MIKLAYIRFSNATLEINHHERKIDPERLCELYICVV
jgi:hypothetical protein